MTENKSRQDFVKREQAEFRAGTFGSATPDHIEKFLADMNDAIKAVLPYQPITIDENSCFLDSAEDNSIQIALYVRRIRNMYGLGQEHNPLTTLINALIKIAYAPNKTPFQELLAIAKTALKEATVEVYDD